MVAADLAVTKGMVCAEKGTGGAVGYFATGEKVRAKVFCTGTKILLAI